MFNKTTHSIFQGLKNTNYLKLMLIFTLLTDILAISFASIMSEAVIRNTGNIVIHEIRAKSGYWLDIQEAVNLAATHNISIVRIPEGVFNFVNPGESWTEARVVIPAGVSIFGASTEKYPNGSVVEWKTVLVMPWDFHGDTSGTTSWFLIEGNSDKSSRISDIRFVGYREFDHNATGLYCAIMVKGVKDFRIDHCHFDEIPEGVKVGVATNKLSCGVIDHCVFENEYAYYNMDWGSRVVGYGVAVNRRQDETIWEPLANLLGKYTNHTVFIEDCVFDKWRSVVAGNSGCHYVFRHNIVKNGLGYGEIDLHPMWTEGYVPARAAEVYENTFINPVGPPPPPYPYTIEIWSGSGVFFNNTVSGYTNFIYSQDSGWNSTFYPHDVYIWNNNIGSANLVVGSIVENEDYFLYKPDWYTPYPYPHPLTLP